MNLMRLMLHPKSSHGRVVIVRDTVTGQDIGKPKHLGILEAVELDFRELPDNVEIVIRKGEEVSDEDKATLGADEAELPLDPLAAAADAPEPVGETRQPEDGVNLAPPPPEGGEAQETGPGAEAAAETELQPGEPGEGLPAQELAPAGDEPNETGDANRIEVHQFDAFPEDPGAWTDEQKAEFKAWFDGLPDETGADNPTSYVLAAGAGIMFRQAMDAAAAAKETASA